MRKQDHKANHDPLSPARSREDWEAQGWAPESVPMSAVPRLEATISIRFDPEGASQLRRAARLTGMTKSEFVRKATLNAAAKVIAETPLPATMWITRPQETVATTRGQETTVIRSSDVPVTTGRNVINLDRLVSS